MLWIDSEVHVLPPRFCAPDYRPPETEARMLAAIYDHPERDLALPLADVPSMLEEMDRSGVARAVIMGMPWADPALCWENNAYVAQAQADHPDRLRGLGILPDPVLEDPVASVERIHGNFGLHGVKVIPSWHGYRLDDPALAPALERMAALDLALVPHTDQAYLDPGEADTAFSLYQVARTHPNLRIAAPHLGGLLCLYALHQPVRAHLDKILFLGSVPATMDMVSFAVRAAGASRVAFATDCPFNSTHDQSRIKDRLLGLGLDGDSLRAVAGENAARFWGWD